MNDIDALDIDSDDDSKLKKRKKIAGGFKVPVFFGRGTHANVADGGAPAQVSFPNGTKGIDTAGKPKQTQEAKSDVDIFATLFGGQESSQIRCGTDPLTALFDQAKQGPKSWRMDLKASSNEDHPAERVRLNPPSAVPTATASEASFDRTNSVISEVSQGCNIPGPAGRLQWALANRAPFPVVNNQVVHNETRGDQDGLDVSFLSNAWTAGSQAVAQAQLTPNAEHKSVRTVLSRTSHERVQRMLVFVSDIQRNGERSAFSRVKDPTGSMGAILHHTTLSAHPNISPGAVLLLKEVAVFSPSPDVSYLCIMPTNIQEVLRESSDAPMLTANMLHHRLNESWSPVAQRDGMRSQNAPILSALLHSTPKLSSTPSAWPHLSVRAPAALHASQSLCTSTTSIDKVPSQLYGAPNASYKERRGGSSAFVSPRVCSNKQESQISLETMPPPPLPRTTACHSGGGQTGNRSREHVQAATRTKGSSCASIRMPPPAQTNDQANHTTQGLENFVGAGSQVRRMDATGMGSSIAPSSNNRNLITSEDFEGRRGAGVSESEVNDDQAKGNVLDLFKEVQECYLMSSQRAQRQSIAKKTGFVGMYELKEITLDDAFTQ